MCHLLGLTEVAALLARTGKTDVTLRSRTEFRSSISNVRKHFKIHRDGSQFNCQLMKPTTTTRKKTTDHRHLRNVMAVRSRSQAQGGQVGQAWGKGEGLTAKSISENSRKTEQDKAELQRRKAHTRAMSKGKQTPRSKLPTRMQVI